MRQPTIISRVGNIRPEGPTEEAAAPRRAAEAPSPRAGGYPAMPSAAKPQPTDKRRARRRTCRSAAVITSPSLRQALGCVVCDSSATGALLEFGRQPGSVGWETEDLPPRFTLNLTLDRMAYDCRIVWKNAKLAGVQFMGPARAISKAVAPRRLPPQLAKSASMLSRFMKR